MNSTKFFVFGFKTIVFLLCLSLVLSIMKVLGFFVTLVFVFASSITLEGIDTITNALIKYIKEKED